MHKSAPGWLTGKSRQNRDFTPKTGPLGTKRHKKPGTNLRKPVLSIPDLIQLVLYDVETVLVGGELAADHLVSE